MYRPYDPTRSSFKMQGDGGDKPPGWKEPGKPEPKPEPEPEEPRKSA